MVNIQLGNECRAVPVGHRKGKCHVSPVHLDIIRIHLKSQPGLLVDRLIDVAVIQPPAVNVLGACLIGDRYITLVVDAANRPGRRD